MLSAGCDEQPSPHPLFPKDKSIPLLPVEEMGREVGEFGVCPPAVGSDPGVCNGLKTGLKGPALVGL